MKCPILLLGNPILRKKSTAVEQFDAELKAIIQNLSDTLEQVNGWGLAAPQIGISKSVFITSVPSNEREWKEGSSPPIKVYINPKIIAYSKESWVMEEGCLSIPNIYVDVERPKSIRIRAQDENGTWFEEELQALPARCCLHENDHLNGVLIIDRASQRDRKRIEKDLARIKRSHN